MNKPLGIYIHIPFCLNKCPYCDFCSHPGRKKEEITAYAKKVAEQLREWSDRCKDHTVDSVYFGGGTPTLMSHQDFKIILAALRECYRLNPDAEISVECNPASSGGKEIAELHALGINRLSIGAQSLDDGELRGLGRLHTTEDFYRIFGQARAAGFENISVDLIYGIPGHSAESFKNTLRALCQLSPEHISTYCLKVEEDTPFGNTVDSLNLPCEDEVAEMYLSGIEIMSAYQFEQYEISNFARTQYQSRHNLKYWNCDEYLGIGISAHSYFGGERFACHTDLERYLKGRFECGGEPIKLSEAERETEYVMLSMRLARGLDAAEYIRRYGIPPAEKYARRFEEFVEGGYVISDAAGYRFTPRGMLVSNHILSSVLDL